VSDATQRGQLHTGDTVRFLLFAAVAFVFAVLLSNLLL
jgi:hypothetical protein